ncbi:MAG: phosphoribosylaminoimidazolesuccinocarboxamide synthase [Cyanobacteria bacterium]|nr:phosphoribosylaminoimidazolesuccinocarboxamide synthase [Cyanobacteriota bacterium]
METVQHKIEGKAKILTSLTPNAPEVLVTFKDCATAFNGQKFAELPGKGQLNAQFSELLFGLLESYGVPTCFLRKGPEANTLFFKRLTMIPLEVVIRNFAYGSVCKRFGFEQGKAFSKPLIEFFLKDDKANDPQITDEMIREMQLLPQGFDFEALKTMAFKANDIFLAYFAQAGIRCGDFKLEFGIDTEGNLMVADELSPDNFRLRDANTQEVLDKDVFRLALGDLVPTYQKLLDRLTPYPGKNLFEKAPLKQYEAQVMIGSRKNVLSPESKAILGALQSMGFQHIQELKAGKQFQVTLAATSMVEADENIRRMTETLLANPVIEDFSWSFQ